MVEVMATIAETRPGENRVAETVARIVADEKAFESFADIFNWHIQLQIEQKRKADVMGVARGMAAELLARQTPLDEQRIVVGRDKLSRFGVIKIQPVLPGEDKLATITELKPKGGMVGTEGDEKLVNVSQSKFYKEESEMPDMYGVVVGVPGYAFPVEIKCWKKEEMAAYVDTIAGEEGLDRVEVNVGGKVMRLGVSPGRQLDLIDWAREQVSLPSLVGKERLMLLRVPKGYQQGQLEVIGKVAEKGVYGKNGQKLTLLIEELPYNIDEVEEIGYELVREMMKRFMGAKGQVMLRETLRKVMKDEEVELVAGEGKEARLSHEGRLLSGLMDLMGVDYRQPKVEGLPEGTGLLGLAGEGVLEEIKDRAAQKQFLELVKREYIKWDPDGEWLVEKIGEPVEEKSEQVEEKGEERKEEEVMKVELEEEEKEEGEEMNEEKVIPAEKVATKVAKQAVAAWREGKREELEKLLVVLRAGGQS